MVIKGGFKFSLRYFSYRTVVQTYCYSLLHLIILRHLQVDDRSNFRDRSCLHKICSSKWAEMPTETNFPNSGKGRFPLRIADETKKLFLIFNLSFPKNLGNCVARAFSNWLKKYKLVSLVHAQPESWRDFLAFGGITGPGRNFVDFSRFWIRFWTNNTRPVLPVLCRHLELFLHLMA